MRRVSVPATDGSHQHIFEFDGVGSHPEPPLDCVCAGCGKTFQDHKNDRRARGEFVTGV